MFRPFAGESTVAEHPGQQDPNGPTTPAHDRAVMEAALRAAVSERLGAARFGLWFGDSVRLGLSGDGDALEVRVPDPFFREWIKTHYSTSLLEAAEAVLGRAMQLSIRIHDEAESPLGDVVQPAPACPEGHPEPRAAKASSPSHRTVNRQRRHHRVQVHHRGNRGAHFFLSSISPLIRSSSQPQYRPRQPHRWAA